MHKWILASLILILLGCARDTAPNQRPPGQWQTFAARDNGKSLERPPIYRAWVPLSWERVDPDPQSSLVDTRLPIASFKIDEGNDQFLLNIHTFPRGDQYPKIPPIAQIQRWKGQFEELDPLDFSLVTVLHGGFSGLCIENGGTFQGKPAKILAWAYQLCPEYDQKLSLLKHPFDSYKRADYTIKAVAAPWLIDKHNYEIKTFADSFELIDELPAPS